MTKKTYTLRELSSLSGLSPRTIRFYIKEGLVAGPLKAGARACYASGHLPRLRLIRRLQQDHHLPLADITAQLVELDDTEVRGLLNATVTSSNAAMDYVDSLLRLEHRSGEIEAKRQPLPTTPSAVPAAPPERSHWERIVLHQDVELLVRRSTSTAARQGLRKLLDIAPELFKEGE